MLYSSLANKLSNCLGEVNLNKYIITAVCALCTGTVIGQAEQWFDCMLKLKLVIITTY